MDINEIIKEGRPIEEIVKDLKDKTTPVPLWEELEKDYNPKKHEIITNSALRPRDKRKKNGMLDRAARILYPAERIVTRRMNQMCFTIPVERKYETGDDETLKEIANAIESIYDKVRINGVNKNRMRAYFGACEMCTVWYAVEEENEDYGFKCKYKFKCRSYSPMPTKMSKISQAKLWPIFDEYDDMVAMCIEYTALPRKVRRPIISIATQRIRSGAIPAKTGYTRTQKSRQDLSLLVKFRWYICGVQHPFTTV